MRYWLLFTLMSILASPALAAEITVSAASSLQDALTEIARAFESDVKADGAKNGKVVLNFGASGALSQQILKGAPVDVIIAAAAKPMDELEAAGRLLAGTRQVLARNSLVLIVPAASTKVEAFADLKRPEVRKIAVGEAGSVPAGDYAQQVFAALGLTAELQSKLVFGGSVRQVLTYVETSNVDAGVVYQTDAATSKLVKTVQTADPATHAPIVYPVAVVERTKQQELARRFVKFLTDARAAAILARYGFRGGRET